MKNKQDKFVQLQLAVEDIYNISRGAFVSVKDHSFYSILKDRGIFSVPLATTLINVLQEKGMMIKEGTRGEMRYKTSTRFVPDLSGVA